MKRKSNKGNNWKMFGIAILAVFLVLGSLMLFGVGDQASLTGGNDNADGDVLSAGCNTAPTLSVSVKDALNQATAVTTGTLYSVNGEYFTTAPSFALGDEVQVIANASSYIDVLSEKVTMVCGANTLNLNIYDYTAPTIEIKEDNTVLSDAVTAGTVNGSALASGGSQTFDVVFTGHDKDTTGDFIYVVELSTTAKVSAVNMYDANGNSLEVVSVPDFYTATLTSPKMVAFKVPAIVNAVEKAYKVTIVAKSGQTVEGAVYTTAYVGEPIVDTDGSFLPFAVENSDGTADYEATLDYDIFLD